MVGPGRSDPGSVLVARNVVLALLGAGILVLKSAYGGPFGDTIHAYAGNVAVSFAMYFAALNATRVRARPRLMAAALALLAVELFEAADGFGVMENTYDPLDFVANALGVALAAVVDVATAGLSGRRHAPSPPSADA